MNYARERYCKKGNHYVSIDKFYKRIDSPGGLMQTCIDCRLEQRKQHEKNKKDGTIKAF